MFKFKAKTFKASVTKSLSEGRLAIVNLVDAFVWAKEHLEEIAKRWPTFSMDWFNSEFRATYGFLPATIAGMMVRISQGNEDINEALRAHLIKTGPGPFLYASKRLLRGQMEEFMGGLPPVAKCRREDVMKVIKALAQEKPEASVPQARDSFLAQLAAVTAERDLLKKENEELKRKLAAALEFASKWRAA